MTKDYSVIALDKFIQATRDSGYKGTANAIAELVDNAIQAGGTRININIQRSGAEGLEITIQDNGCGMAPSELRQALRFGGSSRFNDRSGLGRYGMGLPNSSLSQARRVTVYSWTKPTAIYSTFLDLDDIAAGRLREVPLPRRRTKVPGYRKTVSGTVVLWSRCDRLDSLRETTLRRNLLRTIGRVFRYFIWEGVHVDVDGVRAKAIDPLFLDKRTECWGGKPFARPIEYEVEVPNSNPRTTGRVVVKFTELPIAKWQELSSKEKRDRGISMGAGVSLIRAGREVDKGWFFMGEKRKENYDDWWRCEVQFDPILDELFGVTHTKQQVSPTDYLTSILTPDIEATARALNSRARRAYVEVKAQAQRSKAEEIASRADSMLPRIPRRQSADRSRLIALTKEEHMPVRRFLDQNDGRYGIFNLTIPGTSIFSYATHKGRLVLMINSEHPLAKLLYEPLLQSDKEEHRQLATRLELMFLAAARAEAMISTDETEATLNEFNRLWSDVLATYLLSER